MELVWSSSAYRLSNVLIDYEITSSGELNIDVRVSKMFDLTQFPSIKWCLPLMQHQLITFESLTLSKSFKGLSKLRWRRFPSMGRTGGPGGKFLGLRGFNWRNKIQMQSHSKISETNMFVTLTELVRFVTELQLQGRFSSVINHAVNHCLPVAGLVSSVRLGFLKTDLNELKLVTQ